MGTGSTELGHLLEMNLEMSLFSGPAELFDRVYFANLNLGGAATLLPLAHTEHRRG